ncbi:MAG: nucleoside-diphosphate kinase [Verrucomicrobiae bacterium]|nr:nucleoside-diphosphate kinase [Verrucomicrobiae bacterium]
MSQELAYVVLTPYSLHKSRTGGILSRLISRTGLDLVAARMFAPSAQLVQQYVESAAAINGASDAKIQRCLRDYILGKFSPDPHTGKRRRAMVLVFRGDDAVRKVRAVVGTLEANRRGGETIRDTYADLIEDASGQVQYFEPAVLAAVNSAGAAAELKLWAQYSDADGGLLENVNTYAPGEQPERTLVLIKPDNFRFATGRPGNVIDFFSRTGLFIVAIKVHRMSVAEAMEFYGPVREVLRTKLKDMVANKAKAAVEKELGLALSGEVVKQLGELLGPVFGDNQFDNIVRFMSGRAPSECPADELSQPGSEKCIALIYEGVGAIAKIRDVLGPTDPSKAPPGSIRREFGSSIMVNAAHASDAPESVVREVGIVQPADNTFRREIEAFYAKA